MPNTRRVEIGNRLRECRIEAKLSQADVGAQLEVSNRTISSWENGARTPDAIALADMALLYGVASDYLLFGTHMVPEGLRDLFARVTVRRPAGSSPAGGV